MKLVSPSRICDELVTSPRDNFLLKISKHLCWFHYVWWELIHNSAKEVMLTFCFLLPLLLYSVGIDTRDARVVYYPVRDNSRIDIRGASWDNARITIRGARDNNRTAIRGARDNARSSIGGARDNTRSSIGGARDNTKSSIGGARDNARSSIRVAVDGVSFHLAPAQSQTQMYGFSLSTNSKPTFILIYNRPWPTNFFATL